MSVSKESANAPVVSGNWRPGRRTQIGAAVLVLLSIVVLVTSPWTDRAISKVGFALFNAIAAIWLLSWFLFKSSYSREARLLVVGLILFLAGLKYCFPIVSMSGTLVPSFRWRWSPPADALLAKAEPVAAERKGIDLSTVTDDDFPQFLGPNRNAALTDIDLARDWQGAPPKLRWRQKIGAGWAAFSAVNGYAVTLEQRGEEELVTCYEISTGKLVWSQSERTRHESFLGGIGPRSTPTIAHGKVYALGATGRLRCLDGATGEVVWKKDLLELVGSSQTQDEQVVFWGRANSPLVVDDLVIVPAGGPSGKKFVSLIAFHRETGEKVWEAGDTQISYVSPMFATLAGEPTILSINESNLTAHDPKNGQIRWSFPWPGNSTQDANSSQPQLLPGDRILLTKGYGAGAAMLQVSKSEQGEWKVEESWRNQRSLKTKYTNVAIVDECAFGLSDGILECVDLTNGRSLWKKGRYEHGQLLAVDDLLLVISEDGELVLLEASPRAHRELGKFPALEGRTWNNLCLYGKLLLVRNGEEAACYELP